MLVDSHCHLNDPKFQEDLPQLLERAKISQVGCMLTICTEMGEVVALEVLSDTYKEIYHTVGVHPHEVDREGIPQLEQLILKLKHPKAVGLGETGLDYYYEHSNRDHQKL